MPPELFGFSASCDAGIFCDADDVVVGVAAVVIVTVFETFAPAAVGGATSSSILVLVAEIPAPESNYPRKKASDPSIRASTNPLGAYLGDSGITNHDC